MGSRRQVSKLRQEVVRLGRELAALQRQMLRPRRMVAGSLIERHLGTRHQKRRSAAFYLSYAEEGRTRLRYVPKAQVERMRGRVEAWQAFRAALRRWREVVEQMGGLLRALGEAQAQRPGEAGR